jgi:hypothetical protein
MCLILCIEDVEVIVGLDIVFFYKKKIKFCVVFIMGALQW